MSAAAGATDPGIPNYVPIGDECALFDDAPLASAHEARPPAVMHIRGAPA